MLRFRADDFTAKLPWFYHGMHFDSPREHDVLSFEVNGLELPAGRYDVALVLADPLADLHVSFEGMVFEPLPAKSGIATLPAVDLSGRMLSFYFMAEGDSPLAEVLILPQGANPVEALATAPVFDQYVRDIKADEREVLTRWDEFYSLVRSERFGADDLMSMFARLLDWCERQQVLDEADPHYGAVYSEEDKYDFRDTAAAAVAFTYAWRDSGEESWLERARIARKYVYLGQHTEGERRGGWAHMVSGKWGGDLQQDFRRITQELPGVDGVDNAIIINLLCRAIELGLAPDDEDLERIEIGAGWTLRSELSPGVFAHHEGATHDCQNSNALGAMALSRAHQTLTATGRHAPDEWIEAARRGLAHWLEGQEAIGVWPYLFAGIGRGQAFGFANVPDQGMGGYHFLVACDTPALRDTPGVNEALKRLARWYLCTCRLDETGEPTTVDLEYDREGGGLLFSSFTWCRFMAAAVLARTAARTDEAEPWRSLALRLMEHVRARLWQTEDPDRAPVVRSSRPDIELHSWIAAAEWEAVLVRDIIEHLEASGQ
jgi:hypothetical protein